MFLVGLTGGIATGKSTVARMLSQRGVIVLDADLISRQVVEPGTSGYRQVIKVFSADVLQGLPGSPIDRDKLGRIVFADAERRKQLQRIIWPRIYWTMLVSILYNTFRGEQFIVLDLPLLFESGMMARFCHFIVVVFTPADVQLERQMVRDGRSRSEAQQRIDAQMPIGDKVRLATHVIDNARSLAETESAVDYVLREIRNSNAHWLVRSVLLAALSAFSFTIYMAR